MQWEVTGADRTTGEDRSIIIEADTEDSARRRANRQGLLVADARRLENKEIAAGFSDLGATPATGVATHSGIAVPQQPTHYQCGVCARWLADGIYSDATQGSGFICHSCHSARQAPSAQSTWPSPALSYASRRRKRHNTSSVAHAIAAIVGLVLITGAVYLWLRQSQPTISAAGNSNAEYARKPAPVQTPAATAPIAEPDHVPVRPVAANPAAYGKVVGAGWTVKNDGSSNLLRGMPLVILKRDSTNVSSLIACLEKQRSVWQTYLDVDQERLKDDLEMVEKGTSDPTVERDAPDSSRFKIYISTKEVDGDKEEIARDTSNADGIKLIIDDLHARTKIDRLEAFRLSKEHGVLQSEEALKDIAVERQVVAIEYDTYAQKLAAVGRTGEASNNRRIHAARGEARAARDAANKELAEELGTPYLDRSGETIASSRTNVEGKFAISDVPPGDYYLMASFGTAAFTIEWIEAIHVDGDKETSVDLSNDNAVFVHNVGN